MDKTGYFLLLLVALVLALLCGALEVFTFLTNMENRRLADEYSDQAVEDAHLAAESEQAVLNNLTSTIRALLKEIEALRQEMEMLGIGRGNEIASIAERLEEILYTLNETMQTRTEEEEDNLSNKILNIRGACKTMTVAECTTAWPGGTTGNYTFQDCEANDSLFVEPEGEIIGGNDRDGLLIGKLVHRECRIGRGGQSLDVLASIPSVGSTLDYSNNLGYFCRCYQMANNTVSLRPIQCSYIVTICNRQGTLMV